MSEVWRPSLIAVVVSAAFTIGCGSKKQADEGPSCDQVAEHMLEITQQQLMGHEGVSFKSQKKAMVAQCEQRKMGPTTRKCLLEAQTIHDIAKCRGGKTDVLERPRRKIRPLRPPGANPGSAATVTPPAEPPAGSAK